MARKNKWGVLSERYAVPVLITLLNTDNPKLSDLTPKLGSYNTIENLLFDMEESGLVILNKVTKPYKTTYIALTDRGKDVAKTLFKADEIAKDGWQSYKI